MSHVYCPECGFQNPEAANFCSKCGAALVRDPGGADTTMAFTPEDLDEDSPLEELGMEGPALVVRSGGGRAGEHFVPQEKRTTIGRSPDCDIFLDDVTVSRTHALILRNDGKFVIEDQGSLNGRSSTGAVSTPRRSPTATRSRSASTASRSCKAPTGAPTELGGMTPPPTAERAASRPTAAALRAAAVLREEFPDISISKIRYLEDQGLLAPRRTAGRYRLFGEDDVDRLRTILRLQRDEFLPLRVIRQELSSTVSKSRESGPGWPGAEEEIELAELCERSGLTPALARELEEYGLLESRNDAGERLYREDEADIAAACAKLAPVRDRRAPPSIVPVGIRTGSGAARDDRRAGICDPETRSAGRAGWRTADAGRACPGAVAAPLLALAA